MKIKATFKGEDGSLGYRFGESYLLKLTQPRQLYGAKIQIECIGHEPCIYSTLNKFLDNWTHVRKV